jgi:phage major head subunit gpT-like protein
MPIQSFRSPDISSKAITGYFFQEMEANQRKLWVDTIGNRFSSVQDTETYTGLGNVPQMREWLGGKDTHSFNQASVAITNKDWESTIRIHKKDLRRDKTQQIRARIGELSMKALSHEAKLISDLINAGTGTTLASCYDGKALYANDHSFGDSGTIDNTITYAITTAPVATPGTVADPSPAGFAHAILSGVTQLMTFKDDRGEPINEYLSNILVMYPTNYSRAASLTERQNVLGGLESNIVQSHPLTYQMVHNPRLTDTDALYVFDIGSSMRSFIVQEEVPPILKALAEGSDHEFHTNEHLYSVEKAGNVGLGRFDKTCHVTLV